jgi:sugar lactone lactonase YvrE
MLIVSMLDRRLLRLDPQQPNGLSEVADLSPYATFHCNDMVVASDGRAYVGNFGFDLDAGAPMRPATIVAVAPDGTATVAADEMRFPNGTVITPDGATLIVGESAASVLTAFTIAADGTLTDRRVWARLVGATPDGICLDADGAIWMACPLSSRCLRVAEGGEILEEIATERPAFACMLGGADRRTLYICTSEMSTASETVVRRPGRIQTREVDVAGVGLP